MTIDVLAYNVQGLPELWGCLELVGGHERSEQPVVQLGVKDGELDPVWREDVGVVRSIRLMRLAGGACAGGTRAEPRPGNSRQQRAYSDRDLFSRLRKRTEYSATPSGICPAQPMKRPGLNMAGGT